MMQIIIPNCQSFKEREWEQSSSNLEMGKHVRKGRKLYAEGCRQSVGGGPAGEDIVQVAIHERDPGGARCRYLHLHRVVLRIRDSGDRLYLRGVAEREEGSASKTRIRCFRRLHGSRARLSEMAVATVHGSVNGWRENGRVQERCRGREKTERHAREAPPGQGVQTAGQCGVERLD